MITLERNQFIVDGQPFYVYSGEIHYFRLTPAQWKIHLKAAVDAGLNTVSSYIPWIWHESEEGKFDFTGKTHPQRNLIGYIKEVEKHGLKFIARVGPVSNAEMVNEGIPTWLIKDHPEVFVRGKEITNLPHTTLLAYLNPTFQKYVSLWYDQVLPVIASRQHPAGNIILVQLCNEIGMVHWLQKAAEYSPATEKMYRDFLSARYNCDIKKLNAAYSTKFTDFKQVVQPSSGEDTQNMKMLWDWMNFYQEYYAEYFSRLNAMYEAHGLKLPVLSNIPQFYDFDVRGRGVYAPMTTMMFREFSKRVPNTVFGGAYQMRRLDYENFHDIPLTSEVVKMITTPGVPSICAELQTGIMRDRPRLYGADVELNLKTSTAHGLNAVNAYMFSGGLNDINFGAFGTYHEWQAAVAPDGTKRPHYYAMKNFGRQMKVFGSLVSDTAKQTDAAVGFYAPYYETEYLSGPKIEEWEWKKLHLFYDGLGRLLQLANINYSLYDIQRMPLEDMKNLPSLIVFSMEFMDEATQQKLVEYVKAGGKLLLNPNMPEQNLSLKKCTILADYLGVKVTGKKGRNLGYYIGKQDYLAQGEISMFEAKKAEVVAKTIEGKPCGLLIKKDAGKVLLLGFGINHMFDYQIKLIKDFTGQLGVKASIETDGDFQLVARTNNTYGFLFLSNFHDQPNCGTVKMVLPGEKNAIKIPSRGKIFLGNRRSYIIPLNVSIAGHIIRYATCEILNVVARGKETFITVLGYQNADAEVSLISAAKTAKLDGKPLSCKNTGGKLRLNFTLNGREQLLALK